MTVHSGDLYATKGRNGDYQSDRFWSIRHIDQARNYFADFWGDAARTGLKLATPLEDCKRNADLVWNLPIRGTTLRISMRIRREGYEKFKDFTIRSRRSNGVETELKKAINGWGDYFMYCRGDSSNLTEYSIICWNGWRKWRLQYMQMYGQEPGVEHPNKDGETFFRAYEFAKLPNWVLVRHVTDIKPPEPVRIIEPVIPRIAGQQTNLFSK